MTSESEPTFDLTLEDLTDETQRLSSARLAKLSNLDREDALALADAWPDIEMQRRLSIINQLAELAMDNVDLNFDAVNKLALTDDEAYVRAAAIRGLAEYVGRDLIPVFADILGNDESAEARREAATGLGRYALEAELGHLREGDSEALRDALAERATDIDEDEAVRARALEALGALSGDETDNLIESIYGEDNLTLKIGAVDAMGRTCNDVWLPTVLREFDNDVPEMRLAAAAAAGGIGEDAAIEPLKRIAIMDVDPEVQQAAIHALGEIGGDAARVALKSILYEGDDELADAVQEALAEIAFADDPLTPL